MIDKIKNLSDLYRGDVCGIYKRWIYTSIEDYNKVCGCLQKMSYSINDLNKELATDERITLKKIVNVIVLIDWIKEAYTAICDLIRRDVVRDFCFSKSEELDVARKFFVAIRSFLVAHPLSTSRHKEMGLDGDFICVDIGSINDAFMNLLSGHAELFYHIDYNGLKSNVIDSTDDLLLHSYSGEANKFNHSRFITCKLNDVVNVAKLYVESLYELDKYLFKQRKVNYKL